MRPDFCAASILSSASSIGAGDGRGDRLVLRANDRFGREGAGSSSTAIAPVVEPKGAGAGRALAHARRSPIRNWSARSSRICGAGSPRAVSGGRKRTNRQSLSASGRAIASPLKISLRVGRQFAGKNGGFRDAVEHLAADRLALFRHADDRVERLAPGPDLGLAGGADRGERNDVDLRSNSLRRARSPSP